MRVRPIIAYVARLLLMFALQTAFIFPNFPAAEAENKLAVVAGTALVADIAADLGGEALAVRTIVPAAACPGHYDLKPSDIAGLAAADVIILHEWQAGQPGIQAALSAAPGASAKVRVAGVPGNWMVPDAQTQASLAVADILAAADPENAARYRDRATARVRSVRSLAAGIKARAEALGAADIPVVCDVMQRPFVAWLGFDVVADYGRFEETGPAALAKVAAKAKQANVRLVLDNMQSGAGSGAPLAEELGAGHAVLSNFPGGWPDAHDYAGTAAKNLNLIQAALQK